MSKFKLKYINGNEVQITYRWGMPLSEKFSNKITVSRNELVELRNEIDEFIKFYENDFTKQALSVSGDKISVTDDPALK